MEDEIKELLATHREDQWMLQGLLVCVEAMEMSQELMRARLEVVNPILVFVDLTQEEDEGDLVVLSSWWQRLLQHPWILRPRGKGCRRS